MEDVSPVKRKTSSKVRSSIADFITPLVRAREFALLVMVVAIGVALHLYTGRFFTTANLNAITLGFATLAIMVCGMTAALVSGGFDLSVGSVFAMGGMVAAIALKADLPVPVAILCGVGAGVFAGSINGLLITVARINPFITTLGMLGIARGVSLAVNEGSPVTNARPEFVIYGQGKFSLNSLLFQIDIPNLVLIALVMIFVTDILMRRAALFRQIYYVGGNEEAARLSGINVNRVKLGVYIMSGTLAALAGVLSVSRFTVADPGAGNGEELRIIAACIIGGCSLRGGRGTVIGGLLGLIFVGFINNGMIFLRVPVYWQQLSMGVVLLLAVGFDTLSQSWQAQSWGNLKDKLKGNLPRVLVRFLTKLFTRS